MELLFTLLITVLFACGIYLVMERNLIRFLFGFILLSNAVNLSIFTIGNLSTANPPILTEILITKDKPDNQPVDKSVTAKETREAPLANPLPQALILTAIVISFGLLAFTLVLMLKGYNELNTLDTHKMRLAEPEDSP